MPDLDLPPGDYRERKPKGRRWLWTSVKIWAAGLVAYLVFSGLAAGNVPNAIGLVAMLVVIALGYNDEGVKRLWARKADKPRGSIFDEDV